MSRTAITTLVSPASTGMRSNSVLPKPYIDNIDFYSSDSNIEPLNDATVGWSNVLVRDHIVSQIGGRLPGQYQLLQQWEGYVISVENNDMLCRIVDKTNENNPDEEVTIPLSELEPSELELVKPGAVFYWSIRYADQNGRGRTRDSLIRFRRIPPIKKSELEKSKQRAAYLEQFFSGSK